MIFSASSTVTAKVSRISPPPGAGVPAARASADRARRLASTVTLLSSSWVRVASTGLVAPGRPLKVTKISAFDPGWM
jgi:hypothetical protein